MTTLLNKNIVLVDDHVIIRNGLKELIEKLGAFVITHQFDRGDDFLKALPLKPPVDLVIMDISMPGMNGDEVLKSLSERGEKIPVLVLTLQDDDSMVIRSFRYGAKGYLRKNCTAQVMREALNEIFARGYYLNDYLALSLQTERAPSKIPAYQEVLEQLTVREKEFLKLVCDEKEYTYEQIADRMGVQHRTVDGYRESIFEKFGIKSKTGLVLFVLKHNLISYL